MKKIFFLLSMLWASIVHAQSNLPVVYLPSGQTVHLISPEPIQYVDISSKAIVGDLPLKNVLRLKVKASSGDSLTTFKDAVITIAGENFIAQYHLVPGSNLGSAPSAIDILPGDTKPLDISGVGFSQNQLKAMSLSIFAGKPDGSVEKNSEFGIRGQVNHVYTAGDYIFLDLSYRNKTNLKYDIESLHFHIDDKKVTKASNVQSLEIRPEFVLFDQPGFARSYRNVFVFKKLSFPGNKILDIELSEKQVSGRVLHLRISYQDILKADTLSN